MKKLDDKVIAITGASSGLGCELSNQLLRQNVKLSLCSRNEANLKKITLANSDNTCYTVADLRDQNQCKNFIDNTIKNFGKIDHLILNAGVSMWSEFSNVTDARIFEKLMSINYLHAVYCAHYALPYLQKSQGLITVISSVQGVCPVPYHSGYVASKYALEGFFETLRSEQNNQIDILIARPSWIRGTQLKYRALSSDGSPLGFSDHKRKKSRTIDIEDCARNIITAMIQRKKQLYMPKSLKKIAWLKLICPGLLNKLVKRAL